MPLDNYIYPSIHLSIYLPIYLISMPVCPSTHPPIHRSIDSSIHQSIDLSTYLSLNLFYERMGKHPSRVSKPDSGEVHDSCYESMPGAGADVPEAKGNYVIKAGLLPDWN